MKKTFLILSAALLLAGGMVGGTAWADDTAICVQLVAYGRDKVDSLENEDLRVQATSMLNQAEQECNSGQAPTGIVTAKSAIDLTAQPQ